MKQLVKTADPTTLPTTNYDRVIYNSETDNVIIKGANDNGHPYVDLGLPSGLKWAKYNVGATSETQYGKFFQWGETTTDTDYTWATYKYCNGSETTLTKYNTSIDFGENLDGMSTLRPEDDAARANMGGDWRMPTKAEFQELLKHTTNGWTRVNGINGWKFTSKTDTSKYIFIPAAGSYYNGSEDNVGSHGRVWSSSLDTSFPDSAWNLSFSSGNCNMDYITRYHGLSVRAVRNLPL